MHFFVVAVEHTRPRRRSPLPPVLLLALIDEAAQLADLAQVRNVVAGPVGVLAKEPRDVAAHRVTPKWGADKRVEGLRSLRNLLENPDHVVVGQLLSGLEPETQRLLYTLT